MSERKKAQRNKKKLKKEKTTNQEQEQELDDELKNNDEEREEGEGGEDPTMPPSLSFPRFWPDFKSPKASIMDLFQHPDNKDVFKKFFITSVSMFTLPLLVFWVLQFTDLVVQGEENRTLWAGLGAAVMVQLVSVAYIWIAIREGDDRLNNRHKTKKEQ